MYNYTAVLRKEIWMWGKPPYWTDMNIPRFSAVWENYEGRRREQRRLWEILSLEVAQAVNKIMWFISARSVNPNRGVLPPPCRDEARTEEPSMTAVMISCSLTCVCKIRMMMMLLLLYHVGFNIRRRRAASISANSAGFSFFFFFKGGGIWRMVMWPDSSQAERLNRGRA